VWSYWIMKYSSSVNISDKRINDEKASSVNDDFCRSFFICLGSITVTLHVISRSSVAAPSYAGNYTSDSLTDNSCRLSVGATSATTSVADWAADWDSSVSEEEVVLHCVSKKFPPFNCLELCQILTDFQNFCTARKHMKFTTKPIRQCPSHLRHVATLPWEIKNSNFLQMWRKTQTDCIFQSPLTLLSIHKFWYFRRLK